MRYLIIWLMLISSTYGLRADINHDGRVDLADLSILAEEWLMEEDMANKYVTFDGTGLITVPDNDALDFGIGDFSICFWGNVFSDLSTVLFQKTVGGFNPGYAVFPVEGSLLRFLMTDGISAAFTIDVTAPSDAWHHIAITVDRDGNAIMYIDGVAGTPETIGGNTQTLNNSQVLTIGDQYAGSLDDLRFYKAALTAAEVSTIYNGGTQIDYNADQTPDSGAASFVMEFNEDFAGDDSDEIYSTIPDTPLVGTKTGGVTIVEGEITVTEYTSGETEMADFNYHPSTYASTICFKINAPGAGKTWNMTSLALETTISTPAQGFTDVAWDAVRAGYCITIPSDLPRGSYDILFFLAAKADVTTTTTPETGFSFKWSGKSLLSPVERLTDFVK